MLFAAWLDDPFRPTQDLDLLGFGDPALWAIKTVFEVICQIEAEDDGLVFEVDGLSVQPIREDQQYGGVRMKTTAFLGRTRILVQVDIGFGDAITPAAQELEFPSLLSAEGPRLKAYPKETVIAEKLQAIAALGQVNSRMKDFYDLLALSRLFAFEGGSLMQAMRATFERRDTPLPTDTPVGLSAAFAEDNEKARQWSAFVGREPLLLQPSNFPATVISIAEFVLPPLQAAAPGAGFERRWPAGGPWT